MAKTLSQIDQRFAYITQQAAEEGNPESGVYFQELKMADETDADGNRIFDDNGDVRQVPVDWDEAATNVEYEAWKAINLNPTPAAPAPEEAPAEGEKAPEAAGEGSAAE